MTTTSNKTGWLIPAVAVALIGGVSVGSFVGSGGFSGSADVAANTGADKASTEGQQVVAMVEALPTNPEPAAVTRTSSVDLLETTPVAVAVAPEPAVNRIPTAADSKASAAFFANAQANLQNESSCGDDLRALASEARVYFPSGGLSAGDAGLATARLIGQVLRDCPGFSVQIEGHSDASGNPAFNKILSERRANTVLSRLTSAGINTSNFTVVGMGDTQPSGITGPEEDAFYDRRVEFSIVENTRTASLTPTVQPWQTAAAPATGCVGALQAKVAQTRIFYTPRAITVSPSEMETVKQLAAETLRCDGVRLRLVGHHSDTPGAREDSSTGRLRVLAMMSSLVAAGVDSQRILIGAPSRSMAVPGQPALPNSRVEFQIISD